MEAQQAQVEHLRQQVEASKQTTPAIVAAHQADARAAINRANMSEEQLKQLRDLSPLERDKLLAEIAGRKQSTALSAAETGNVGAGVAEQRRQYNLSNVPMQFKQEDGTIITRQVATADVNRAIKEGAVIDRQEEQHQYQRAKDAAAENAKVQETALKNVTIARDAEEQIKLHPNEPANEGRIAEHNTLSDNPYVYVYQPSATYSPFAQNIRKIPLIDAKGNTFRAKDIAKLAREKGISVEEYVKTYVYKGREMYPGLPAR